MSVASSDLDTSVTVGDKIVRTAEGAYISSAGAAAAILPSTDRAWNLPEGSRIAVTGTSPVLFTADIPKPPATRAGQKPIRSVRVTTTGLTTPISTVLAGLDTWSDLVLGAPTT